MEKSKRLFTKKDLLALIVPLIIESALSLVVGMIDSVMVSSAGEAAVSGVSLIDTVMVLIFYIFSAMAAGGAVVAGEYEQAKYYNRRLILLTMLANLGLGTFMYLGLPLILNLYTLSAETAALIGSMFLWHTIGAATLWPLSFVQTASLRAAGDVKYPMIMSIVSMWVFRFGGAYLLCYGLNLGAVGIWISMAMLDWGLRAVIYALRWRSGKWRSMKVI